MAAHSKTTFVACVLALCAHGLVIGQAPLQPEADHVVVEDFHISLEVALSPPPAEGGLADSLEMRINFLAVSFRQGYVAYGDGWVDFDDVEFDLNFSSLCGEMTFDPSAALLMGDFCDRDERSRMSGAILGLGQDEGDGAEFPDVQPRTPVDLWMEIPAWAEDPEILAGGSALFSGSAQFASVRPQDGILELEWEGHVWMPSVFLRGDCNADSRVDLSDALSTLGFLFLDGVESSCDDACDSNDDGAIDVSDAINTLRTLFLGDATIPSPSTNHCGADPTPDELQCGEYQGCAGPQFPPPSG